MGAEVNSPVERNIRCPSCHRSIGQAGSTRAALMQSAVVQCQHCGSKVEEDGLAAAAKAGHPLFDKVPTEDTPVVHLGAHSPDNLLDNNLTPDHDYPEGLGEVSSVGGYTDQELESMEDFARSLAAKRASRPSPPPLPQSGVDNDRERELRERLERILHEGLDVAADSSASAKQSKKPAHKPARKSASKPGSKPPSREAIDKAIDRTSDEAREAASEIDQIAAELGRTLRGLPGDPKPGQASERRGSGFILLPTRDIREAIGEGVYRLRVDGEEFGPVDATGVVALIKHGAVMAADQIAAPGGEWMPIMEHPAFRRLRSMMAAEAHRVLRSLDITARRLEAVEQARQKAATQPAKSPALEPKPHRSEDGAQAQPAPQPAPARVDLVSVVVALLVGIAIGWALATFL